MRMGTSVLILSLLSAPVWAQTPAAPAPAAAVGALAPATSTDKRAMDRVEQHIKELHSRLAITPAQEPQWNAFAAIMRQNAQGMESNYNERQSHLAGMTAVDDIKSYAATSHLHADSVDKLLPAFESLYATMSPEQRAATDKTFRSFQRASGRPGKS